MSSFKIKNEPDSQELWAGIGGNFDSLSQIICEFIDNSISNFVGNNCPQRNISVKIKNMLNLNKVRIIIEDSGTGIKNLDAAFTLGSREGAESPYSEHGFGMKHALASANPTNDNWAIYTKTIEDFRKSTFKKISSPYKINGFSGEELENKDWPKEGIYGQTGIIVMFDCEWDMFASLGRGVAGGVSRFDTLCDILYEDLGYIYSNIISTSTANISLCIEDLNGEIKTCIVKAVEPKWEQIIDSGEGSQEYDLGNGMVKINYHFGTILDSRKSIDANGNDITRSPFDNSLTRKYYGRNMTSSGVELRFNGRVMCYNLFKEIWNIEKHNAYNDLLITIDLESSDINRLPQTRTSKNGLREGDPKLEKLYEWIRGYLHEPKKT